MRRLFASSRAALVEFLLELILLGFALYLLSRPL